MLEIYDERREIAARLREPFDIVGHGRYVALNGTLFGMQILAKKEEDIRRGVLKIADLIDPGMTVNGYELLAIADDMEYVGGRYDAEMRKSGVLNDPFARYARRIRKSLGVIE